MNTTKIKSGKAEVISSGTIISFRGQPIEIQFGNEVQPITLVFEFVDDKTKGDSPCINATAEGLVLKLNLINFNNPLGSGSSTPLQIGTLNGKMLFLNYRVYQIGNADTKSDRTLQYTIYLVEEDE